MPLITGKTVVVTGGSRGIGFGLVQKFLARDNTVIATARRTSEAAGLHELKSKYPAGRLQLLDLDTSQPDNVAQWAAGVKGCTSHVDVLVNNAGAYGRRLPLEELEASDFMFAFQTNTIGPFLVVQQLLKQGLLGAPGSLVVNISSIAGSHGDPTVSANLPGGYAYRSSKAALNMINKVFTIDLSAKGIESTCLHPGYVKTDMTGGQGWVDVETSVTGMMAVLESGQPLNDKFHSYDGSVVPW